MKRSKKDKIDETGMKPQMRLVVREDNEQAINI